MAKRRCRNAKGRFTKCSTKGARKSTKGTKRKSTGRVGRCIKWSKGKTRCMQRAK